MKQMAVKLNSNKNKFDKKNIDELAQVLEDTI